MDSRLSIGSSSWSEKAWSGPFYPAGVRAADYLRYYATRFPAVEADTTYYRVPPRKLVSGWDEKTPEGFVLSAKIRAGLFMGESARAPTGNECWCPNMWIVRRMHSLR